MFDSDIDRFIERRMEIRAVAGLLPSESTVIVVVVVIMVSVPSFERLEGVPFEIH